MKFNSKTLSTMAVLLSLIAFRCTPDDVSPDSSKPEVETHPRAVAGAGGIAGVNWADGRDNFVDGWVIPSGLTASDDYATVSAKTNSIISALQTNMPGVNTLRLPINPPSVAESWWGAYTGAIDQALSRNVKVILACWESASSRDGLIDNTTDFWNMWQTVINKYGSNNNVYFEVFNEPHGYSLSALTTIYAEFLSRYPSVPRGRIILGGTGYSQNVTQIGADSRFTSCLLSIHNYSWFSTNGSAAAWEQNWRNNYGAYASRTIATEYGAAMNTGKNYTGPSNGDAEINYMQGSTNAFRIDGVTSVYWPGIRDGDSYAIQTRGGSGNNITLTTTNSSGLARIRFGWGENVSGGNVNITSGSTYRIINRNSGKVLTPAGGSTADGANIVQVTNSNTNAQKWVFTSLGNGFWSIRNLNSSKYMDINGASTANGAYNIQWPSNGGTNQQWQIIATDGYYYIINRNSGKLLDINGASTADNAQDIQWPANGGNNQQWQIIP
jgi:endoglucanase